MLTQLDSLPPTDDANRQFDRAMLRYMLESDLAAFPFDQSRMPFSNVQGFFRIPGNVAIPQRSAIGPMPITSWRGWPVSPIFMPRTSPTCGAG
ncbi:hypothetical protein IDJ81_04180 [Tsuneonella flava]|uniref:Uncharacterized protein n=1 Tax=Tsuneonella flava TaxID=2055955 RepID=A0ABX7KDZ4_9SPHN|nr:hypothetical protein [Tsuneonella flava]QSB45331.1 hypothetical protein IDJ81_04180 [Tsuneonella flava]